MMTSMLAAALVMSSLALEIESESSYRTYEVRAVSEETLLFAPFSQSLRFSVTQPIRRGHVGFNTYFRAIGDTALDGSTVKPKIYIAHFDFEQGRRHPVQVRVGRQISSTSTSFFTFDGLRARYRTPMFFAFEAYGGTMVNQAAFEDPSKADRFVVGGSAALVGVTGTQFRVGVREVLGEDELGDLGSVREDLSLDFGQLLGKRFKVYGNANFNSLLLTMDEALLGTSYLITAKGLRTELEGFRYRPSYDADSIFNFFQTTPFHEVRGRIRMPIPAARTSLYARAGAQIYSAQTGLDAMSVVAGGGGRTLLGDVFHVSYNGLFATGFGGQRAGGNLSAGARLFDNRLTLSGGTHVMSATSEVLTLNKGTFLSFYGAARLSLKRRVELAIQAEDQLSDVGGNRVRLTANLFLRWDTYKADEPKARRKPRTGRDCRRRRGR